MPRRRWLMEIKYLVEYLLVWPLVALARRLSEEHSRAFARFLGRLAYLGLGRDRGWALRNLELVFGDHFSSADRRRLAARSFEHILQTRVEMLRWTPEWMAAHVIEEGGEQARDAARRARAQGRGVIMITGHLGNFELLPPWCHYTGWQDTVVMYRPQDNWRVERLLQGARSSYLAEMVPRGAFSTLGLMYALREGRSVGLVIDQNVLEGGVFVDFLGVPASSPPGVAALALATRCPVILALSIRRPDGRHRLVFHPPFELIDTGDRRRDVLANTEQYMRAIGAYVLAHPEQYNWPHPRWRKRPDGSLWSLATPPGQMAAERCGPPLRPTADPASDVGRIISSAAA